MRTFASTTVRRTIQSLGIITIVGVFSGTAIADSYDEQIKALQQQADAQSQQAAAARAEADGYQSQVAALTAQNNALQTQIRAGKAQYAKVTADIADAQARMATQKAALTANIRSMYVDSTVTPIEMVASSRDLSDYFDQQQYKDSIKSKIQSAIEGINKLKLQLEDQQREVANLLQTQNAQAAQIQANVAEVSRLQAIASSNAAAADAAVRNSNAEITKKRSQQAAELAAKLAAARRSSGGGGAVTISPSSTCGGGYPDKWCKAGMDTLVDSWGMYNRECVSYTAYKVYASGRNMPYWGGRGNAKQWPGNAMAAGIPTDQNPRVGDVAITMDGPYGHAMYVEAVSGGMITVSQYNYTNNGTYSVMTVPASFADYFIHFR